LTIEKRKYVLNAQKKLPGIVEVDESCVGGKPRLKGESKRGLGTKKTPVLSVVQRKGNVRACVIPDVTAKTLQDAIKENVHISARIITDEFSSYNGIGNDFPGGHDTINHGKRQYVRGDVYTNTAESFFALLKRGMYGTFHAVSKKHLHRYVDEFQFRWDTRKINDGARLATVIKAADGKRLMYREPTQKIA
jgi:transposase-like protein